MRIQENVAPGGEQTSSGDPRPGPFSTLPGVARRGTMSTMSSEKYSPLPAGTWTFEIHGNCPRCHHHHRATMMKITVYEDPTRACDLHCGRCASKWLAIGGRNTTQLSLLSTLSAETADRDHDELDFRYSLFSIVRSAAAIASPTLATVPESSAHVPSRGNSARSPRHSATQDDATNLIGPTSPHEPMSLKTSEAVKTPPDRRDVGKNFKSSKRSRLSKRSFKEIKHKVKKALPLFKFIHFSKFISRSKEAQKSAKVEGKQPVLHAPKEAHQNPTFDNAKELDIGPNVDQSFTNLKDPDDTCLPSKGKDEAVKEIKDFDKDKIKNMTPEERTRWVRKQITAFKCRCSRQCSCKRRRSTTSIMVDGSTQIPLLPPLHRHHSADFLLLGSHFDYFGPGMMFPDDGNLSITSATRTSEADTVVEHQPATSGPRNSYVDSIRHERHRSLSPGSTALVTTRYSLQMRQQGLVPRVSMDSMIAGSGRRSTSRRRGTDRRSAASFAPIVSPLRADSPETLASEPATVEQANSSALVQGPSAGSTPDVNGYLTDDERSPDTDIAPTTGSTHV